MELRELVDREEIRDLLFSYCNLLDHHDFINWADLFVADGVFDAGFLGAAKGRKDLIDFIGGLAPLAHEGPSRKHLVSNISFNFFNDHVEVESYYIQVRGSETEVEVGVSGRYFDKVVRDGDRWRFEMRRVTMDLRGDMGLKRY